MLEDPCEEALGLRRRAARRSASWAAEREPRAPASCRDTGRGSTGSPRESCCSPSRSESIAGSRRSRCSPRDRRTRSTRSTSPTWFAASPTPGAVVHRLEHVVGQAPRARSSKRSTGRQRPAQDGIAQRPDRHERSRAAPHRCGSASTRVTTPRSARPADRGAERPATSPGSSGDQAYRLVPERRDEQRPVRERARARPRAPRDPATRKTGAPTGNPASARRRGLDPGEPLRPSGDERLHGVVVRPVGLHDDAPVRPAHAAASTHADSARSRAAMPGRAQRRVRVQDADQVQLERAEVLHARRARRRATSPVAGRPRRVAGPSRRTGTRATPRAHSSTRSAPPRAIAEVRRPAARASARAPRRPRSGPPRPPRAASRRTRRTRPARRTPGRPGRPRSREAARTGTPSRGLLGAPRTSRGARPSGPGLTTSTGGHRRPTGSTSTCSIACASSDGHHRRHHADRLPRCARARPPPRARGSTAPAPPGAARDAPARTYTQPQPRHRREHRRPRPHHDPVPPRADLQPHPIPLALVPPEEQRATSSPNASTIAGHGRGHRIHLRHDHDRRPPRRERRRHALDRDAPPRPPAPVRSTNVPAPPRSASSRRGPFAYRRRAGRPACRRGRGAERSPTAHLETSPRRSDEANRAPQRRRRPPRRPPPRPPEAAPPARSPSRAATTYRSDIHRGTARASARRRTEPATRA